MRTNIISKKGHRQWCAEFLDAIGFKFEIEHIEFDKIAKKRNWDKSYTIDKYSMQKDNPEKGKVQHNVGSIKI